LGHTQAKNVASHINILLDSKSDIWCSPLIRAKQTAKYINHSNIITVLELQEHHSPCKANVENMVVDKIWPDFTKRVFYVIDLIRNWCNENKNTNKQLIIIGHQTFFSCLLTRICSYETIIPRKTTMFRLDNCSISIFRHDKKKRWVIDTINKQL